MLHFFLMSSLRSEVRSLVFVELEYLVISRLASLELTQVIMMVSVNASQATVFVGQVVVVAAGVVMMMVSVVIVV